MGDNVLSSIKHFTVIPFSKLNNWSAQCLKKSEIRFNKKYPLVHIGEFLTRNKTGITIQNEQFYQRITIRTHNGGVIIRDNVKGCDIGTKKQFRIKSGQFVVSKIDARNGAMGIVPKELNGAIVTQDFMAYDVNDSLILPEYLLLVVTTNKFVDFCQRCSSGTTNRQRVDETKFLDIKIPVPSLAEQNTLIAEYNRTIGEGNSKFNEGAIKIREAREYLFESIGVERFIFDRIRNQQFRFETVWYDRLQQWDVDKILDSNEYDSSKYDTLNFNGDLPLFIDIKRGKSPKYDKDSKSFILNQKCIRWGVIDSQHAKSVNKAWLESIDEQNFTQVGDVLINSTGEGTIGRAAVVDKNNSGQLYDSHILLLRLNKKMLDPQYFTFVFNSSYGQLQVNNVKSAKTTKQTELGVGNLKKICLPIPPISVQQDIVRRLTAMYKEISELQQVSRYYQKAISDFESKIFE